MSASNTRDLPFIQQVRAAALEDLRGDPIIRQVRKVDPVIAIKRIGGALRLQPARRPVAARVADRLDV